MDFYLGAMDLIQIRHNLHSIAELSGQEKRTSELIIKYLSDLHPDILLSNIGGFGIIAVFDSKKEGSNVLFRADIDALPITETNIFSYKSSKNGVSHKCGHDGHAAIMLGLAKYVSENRPSKGKLTILFQPAEEIGKGAYNVINDPQFTQPAPQFAFALHNIPGFPIQSVVVKNGTFAAASKGIRIELKGIASHASEPENGNSPVAALARLMQDIPAMANPNPDSDDFSLITIVHISSGTPAFGSTPGNGLLMLTLRAWNDSVIDKLTGQIIEKTKSVSTIYSLDHSIDFHDEFPGLINDDVCADIVRNAASKLSLKVIEPNLPFRWSEDFAHFTSMTKGVLFGIGSGTDHPPLHNPEYDFPDEVIETALNLWKEIYNSSF